MLDTVAAASAAAIAGDTPAPASLSLSPPTWSSAAAPREEAASNTTDVAVAVATGVGTRNSTAATHPAAGSGVCACFDFLPTGVSGSGEAAAKLASRFARRACKLRPRELMNHACT